MSSPESAPPPTEYDTGCFWHGEEPPRLGDYRMCGECGHIFRTLAELQAAHVEQGGSPESAALFCPYCVHDW